MCMLFVVFCFFFKQKTAYEMRISDWSSDVCSSDPAAGGGCGGTRSACAGDRQPEPEAGDLRGRRRQCQLPEGDGRDGAAAARRRGEGRVDERPQAPERPVMRETRPDSTQAVVLAIARHGSLFALMFVGLWWNTASAPIAAAG